MGNRNLWIAAAVVAVLAIVIVVGLQQRQGDVAVGSPSPTASRMVSASVSTAAMATAAASGRPTGTQGSALYNDLFGFVVTDIGAGASIRNESGAAQQGLSFSAQGFAVSPDGKNIAYWTLGTSSAPQQLRTFTTLGNATEQTWVTLAAGQRGGGIAWSGDGAGLLYSTETGNFGVGGGTNSATLDIYELAAGGRRATIETQNNTGALYRPIAWDRSANIAAAGMTGEGVFLGKYVAARINSDGSFAVQRVDTVANDMAMGSIRASSDAKLVLGVDGSGRARWWPIADVSAIKTAAAIGRTAALWLPGTHKIGFIGADGGFVLFQADDGSAATPFRGVKAGSTVRTFRADGTAVLLAFVPPGSTGLGSTDYTLTRLADGGSITFQATGGLGPSVRLR